MQIIEHQYLHYKNLLIFESDIDYATIPDYSNSIATSLDVLDLKQMGNIIFKIESETIQFIIPVNRRFINCKHYKFKEEFKIVNAIRARHYGDIKKIYKVVDSLSEYIQKRSMVAITPPYYSVNEIYRDVYDVYIGLSENVL